MGVSAKLFFEQNLQAGYSLVGTVDLPFVKDPVGYIHLHIEFFWFDWKIAWKIT